MLARWGVDVALVRVSPPDKHGQVSLGGSVGYGLDALRLASVRIAEVDPSVPRTCGQSTVPVTVFDALIESATAMPEHVAATPDETSRVIAEHVLGLLPRDPVLQIGIGGIPESVLAGLAGADLGSVRFEGMASDGMVDLFEQGCLDPGQVDAVRSPELMGTSRLMSFAAANPAIGVYPSSSSHDTARLGRLDRLVSVNGAIEVDLQGQVNVETVRGRPVAGVGGSLDFVEGAGRSPGGVRVVAIAAASPDGTASRIVPSVSTVTVPGASTDVVVTEHGIARLEGLTARERAEALIAIAHPDHRDALADGAALS
jgi:acyl-CoA hydrolase